MELNGVERSRHVMREKIRYGQDPDNPALIPLWLDQEAALRPFDLSLEDCRHYYESQFRLLLEAVLDELVPSHWRRLCLDYIYQPLSTLKKLSDGEQSERHIRQLINELSISCRYVEASLNRQS